MHPDIQVRNPNYQSRLRSCFKEYLGITNVIWLGDGEGDDTHGHIDDLCRFINEDTIVTIIETNTDSNYLPLQDNKAFTKQTGKQEVS
jgi:agmatine deiminase